MSDATYSAEARARVEIDRQLVECGWLVQDRLGYADDVIIAAAVLRRVVRLAGVEPLDRHWQGTAAGLEAIRRLAGLRRREPSHGLALGRDDG